MQQRFRTLGYHEAYDHSKQEKLQDGFQDGYQDTYEASMRIGELLGKVVMQSELGESRRQQEPSQSPRARNGGSETERLMAKNASKMIRSFVLDPGNHGRLSELESRIKEMRAVVEPPNQGNAGGSRK
jgi:hypothetical protein